MTNVEKNTWNCQEYSIFFKSQHIATTWLKRCNKDESKWINPHLFIIHYITNIKKKKKDQMTSNLKDRKDPPGRLQIKRIFNKQWV